MTTKKKIIAQCVISGTKQALYLNEKEIKRVLISEKRKTARLMKQIDRAERRGVVKYV